MLPTVQTAMGVIAAVLLGVWGIVARYDSRVRDRMDGQLGQPHRENSDDEACAAVMKRYRFCTVMPTSMRLQGTRRCASIPRDPG